jgi:hypothetical protein
MRNRWASLDLPFTALLLVLLMLVSDFTDNWWRGNITRMQWLVLDTTLQTIISIIVAAPLLLHPLFRHRFPVWLAALVLVIAALDLDHFVAAGSLRLEDALSLPYRPVSHSLGFALLLGLAGLALTRRWQAGLLFFTGLSAHILHDVQNSGAPLFWPLSSETIFLPFMLYLLMNLALLTLAAALSAKANRRTLWSSGLFSVLYLGYLRIFRRSILPEDRS